MPPYKIYNPRTSSEISRPARSAFRSGAAYRSSASETRSRWLMGLLFLLVSGGVIYGLFFSPLFLIKHYKLSVSPRLSESAAVGVMNDFLPTKLSWWQYPVHTVWLYRRNTLLKNLQTATGARTVALQYHWTTRELQVDLEERRPSLALVYPGLIRFYDQDQKFLEEKSVTTEDYVQAVKETYPDLLMPIVFSAPSFTPLEWDFWYRVMEHLETAENIKVVFLTKLEAIAPDVKTRTNVGYDIIWDPAQDLDKQLRRLKIVLQQVSDPKTLQYIDVRFEGKVIYK